MTSPVDSEADEFASRKFTGRGSGALPVKDIGRLLLRCAATTGTAWWQRSARS
jgi:hypothetical protein